MSAWGTAIFSDDLAMDIRRDYGILLATGKENSEAEDMLIKYYSSILNSHGPDEEVFWYALALSEWKKGRLSDFVKEKALRALDAGKDLERWNVAGNEKNYEKRKQVLKEFRNVILQPMPALKKIKKPTVHHCPWKEGDLLAYRIVSNKRNLENHPCFMKYVLLRVVRVEKHPVTKIYDSGYYDETMLVALYNWMGSAMPSSEIVNELNYTPVMDIPKDLKPLLGGKAEKFAWLDWLPTKDAPGDITTLGHDENYRNAYPDYFKNPLCSRVLTHLLSFDLILSDKFEPYWGNDFSSEYVFI